jgi:hypothetical protein
MIRWVGVALLVAAGVVAAEAGEREMAKAEGPRQFTLGLVQKGLRAGLSQAEVAERLGSPNIVTRDPDGRDAWVYDKVSTEVEASGGSIGLGGLGSGASSSFGGLFGIAVGKQSEKARSSQRTLTVVIRFSTSGAVESYTWHDSRF